MIESEIWTIGHEIRISGDRSSLAAGLCLSRNTNDTTAQIQGDTDMDTRQRDRLLLIGRVLIGMIFLFSGLGKIGGWQMVASMMAAKGVPLVSFTLALTILVEVGGGLSLLVGYKARAGAIILALFLIPTTLVMHAFWSAAGMEAQMQMVNFLKNLAIMGGLCALTVTGAGRYSLDGRGERRAGRTELEPGRA
jgi:putative oxidoreductase